MKMDKALAAMPIIRQHRRSSLSAPGIVTDPLWQTRGKIDTHPHAARADVATALNEKSSSGLRTSGRTRPPRAARQCHKKKTIRFLPVFLPCPAHRRPHHRAHARNRRSAATIVFSCGERPTKSAATGPSLSPRGDSLHRRAALPSSAL